MVQQKAATPANDSPRLQRSPGQKRRAGQRHGGRMKEKRFPRKEEASSWSQIFLYPGSKHFAKIPKDDQIRSMPIDVYI